MDTPTRAAPAGGEAVIGSGRSYVGNGGKSEGDTVLTLSECSPPALEDVEFQEESSGDVEARPGRLRAILVSVDVAAITVALLVVTAVSGLALGAVPVTGLADVIVLVAMLGALAMSGLYKSRVASIRTRELSRLVPVAAAGSLLLDLSYRALGSPMPVAYVLLFGALALLALVVGRSAFDDWLRARRREGRYCRSIVILGTGPEAVALESLLADHPELGYRTAGLIGPLPEPPAPVLPWLGETDDLLDELHGAGADGVFVTSDWLHGPERFRELRHLLAAGVHVHLSGGVWGVDHRRLRPVPIAHQPLFYLEQASLHPYQVAAKRVLDLVIAPLVLVLTAPVLVVAALAIKLEDGGPVFYRQRRVGHRGHEFVFLKLRTMVAGADRVDRILRSDNARSGPLYKAPDDPRVTRVGRFLRVSSIDELPQLLNVILGDMSLVGPRPALPSEVESFDEELLERNRVRPGITGLWQVEARDNPSFTAYRRLDLFYIENWTLSLDVIILVLTVEQVLARIVRSVRRSSRVSTADVGA